MGMKRGERDVMWESYMWFIFGNYCSSKASDFEVPNSDPCSHPLIHFCSDDSDDIFRRKVIQSYNVIHTCQYSIYQSGLPPCAGSMSLVATNGPTFGRFYPFFVQQGGEREGEGSQSQGD